MLESEPRERNEPVEARRKDAGRMGVKLVVPSFDVDIVTHHHDPHAAVRNDGTRTHSNADEARRLPGDAVLWRPIELGYSTL